MKFYQKLKPKEEITSNLMNQIWIRFSKMQKRYKIIVGWWNGLPKRMTFYFKNTFSLDPNGPISQISCHQSKSIAIKNWQFNQKQILLLHEESPTSIEQSAEREKNQT